MELYLHASTLSLSHECTPLSLSLSLSLCVCVCVCVWLIICKRAVWYSYRCVVEGFANVLPSDPTIVSGFLSPTKGWCSFLFWYPSCPEEWLCPVLCRECEEELGAYDEQQVYHFFNVLASNG